MTGARPKSEVLSEFRAGLQALLAATPRSVRARMRLNIHAGPPPPMTPGGGTVFGREPDEIIFLLRQPDPPASPERALLEKCGLASPGVFFCDASGRDMHMEKIFLALSAIRPDENMVCVSNGPGDEYKALAEQVRKAVVGMLSDIKFESNSRLMRARCAIHNMRPLLDGRARLARPAKEAPNAVVCGAGPSLADDIGTIKKYRESFVVVSVGRAARHLEAAGVSPDFLVEIDMDCD